MTFPAASLSRLCMALAPFLFTAVNVQASGFAIPERSAAGMGMANALVANPDDISALAYNPSLAVFHQQANISNSLMLIKPTLEVTPSATGGSYQESQGDRNVWIPGLSGHLTLPNQTALILNVSAPFGLETNWPNGTFPEAASYDPSSGLLPGTTGAAQPTDSKLAILGVSPSVAFKINDHTAFALGLDYYQVREVAFNAVAKQNEGDGDGWGYNLSFTNQPTANITLGLSYHSPATANIEGTTVASSGTSRATTELTLPWRVQLGLQAAINDDLALEFDITRTGWNNFNVLQINSDSPTTSVNNWKDANTYHLGMQYALHDKTRLRLGYSYDKTRQPDRYFGARVPDSDRHLFGIGIGHQFDDGWNIDAGYMYVLFKDRAINNSTTPTPPGTDLNGTNAYNGTYKTHAHLLGITLSKHFDL